MGAIGSRVAAKATGAERYHGQACQSCPGKPTDRYTQTGKCIACADSRASRRVEAHQSRRDENNGKAYLADPCSDCGGTLRGIRKDDCIACRRTKSKRYKTSRATYMRHRYGVSLEYVELLTSAQSATCAICETTEPGSKGWHLDHCHATGTIRGTLCESCNWGLGRFRDSIETMEKAIAYLRGSNSHRVFFAQEADWAITNLKLGAD